jgi:hypothetical protein
MQQGMTDPGNLPGLGEGIAKILRDVTTEVKRERPVQREGDQDGRDNQQHDLTRA